MLPILRYFFKKKVNYDYVVPKKIKPTSIITSTFKSIFSKPPNIIIPYAFYVFITVKQSVCIIKIILLTLNSIKCMFYDSGFFYKREAKVLANIFEIKRNIIVFVAIICPLDYTNNIFTHFISFLAFLTWIASYILEHKKFTHTIFQKHLPIIQDITFLIFLKCHYFNWKNIFILPLYIIVFLCLSFVKNFALSVVNNANDKEQYIQKRIKNINSTSPPQIPDYDLIIYYENFSPYPT